MARSRAEYEAAVRQLATLAISLRERGLSDESIARELVARRNALKVEFREGINRDLLERIEQSNRERYGDAVGPDADTLFARYGSWDKVIAAAARPADLRNRRF